MMWNDLFYFVLVPVLRSVEGWLRDSLADGFINEFEWRKLAETILRVSFINIMIYFGLDQIGIDPTVLGTAAIGYLFDKIYYAIKPYK